MDEWIVGRKEIKQAAHCTSWQTIRNWRRKYGLVLLQWPNTKPAIRRSTLEHFLTKFKRN